MRRDLNYFSKYHVAPAKTSPLKLAAISAFAGIAAIMIVLIAVFDHSTAEACELYGVLHRFRLRRRQGGVFRAVT